MALTQHGPKCDVCGHYILPLDPQERINMFSVKGNDSPRTVKK